MYNVCHNDISIYTLSELGGFSLLDATHSVHPLLTLYYTPNIAEDSIGLRISGDYLYPPVKRIDLSRLCVIVLTGFRDDRGRQI